MRGKKFYTHDGVRMATRDPNIIKQWAWAENVGMACGEPSRTDVFDIDDLAAAGFDVDALAASTLAATTPSAGGTCSSSCRTSQPLLFFWRMEVDRPCGCAAASARATVAQRSSPQPAPPVLIELVKQLIKSAVVFSSFPLLVATGDELPKPIYEALLRAMPLSPVLRRRHQRWAGSILRKLIAYRDGRNAALMRATFDFRSIIAQADR